MAVAEGDEATCNNCKAHIVFISPRHGDPMWVHNNGEPQCTFYAEPKPEEPSILPKPKVNKK